MFPDLCNELGKYSVIITSGIDGQNYENETPDVIYLNYPCNIVSVCAYVHSCFVCAFPLILPCFPSLCVFQRQAACCGVSVAHLAE